MRISTTQFYETSTANYQRTYANVVKTGEEVSSQIKLNSAADDPVGAARVLQLNQQNSMLTQYKSNISSIDTNVTKSETALRSIQDALQTANELILGASNGTFTDADRKSNADQLQQLQSQILSLMNSQDSNGQYLFSGSKGTTAPYVQNPDGTYAYQGDQTSVQLAIGDGLSVAGNTTGWEAFEMAVNTTRTSATLTTGTDNGKVTLSNGAVSDSASFNAAFIKDQPYKVVFLSSTEYKITNSDGTQDLTSETGGTGKFSSADAATQSISFRGVALSLNVNLTDAEKASTALADAAVGGRTYTLAVSADNISTTRSPGNVSPAVVTGAAVGTTAAEQEAYHNTFPADGAVLKFTSGGGYSLYASPLTGPTQTAIASGTITAPATSLTVGGVKYDFSATPVDGDQFVVKGGTQQTQNVLNTLGAAITALNVKADGDPVATQKLQAALQSAIGNVNSAKEQLSTAISGGGARQASAKAQDITNDLLLGNNTLEQGKIIDSDPVDAIGRLTMQQTMLTASQLVFTRVSQLNLFSKL
ncbi:flagellar hook-associated protein 3 [Pseudomonas caspiana]